MARLIFRVALSNLNISLHSGIENMFLIVQLSFYSFVFHFSYNRLNIGSWSRADMHSPIMEKLVTGGLYR